VTFWFSERPKEDLVGSYHGPSRIENVFGGGGGGGRNVGDKLEKEKERKCILRGRINGTIIEEKVFLFGKRETASSDKIRSTRAGHADKKVRGAKTLVWLL